MLAVVAILIAVNAQLSIFAHLVKIQIHFQNSIKVAIAEKDSTGLKILMERIAAFHAIMTASHVTDQIFA